ncbi:phage major capsid protein [Nocardia sp. NPDC049149]|uniref:phage major capsid protein n=1 Tax=Nocardia sp. NPDC049149 TaxID=3364315 RepID=UPI0037186D14
MADISRAEVATLIQEGYSNVLLDEAAKGSTALQAFPTVSMGTKTTHMPVLATLPEASWVTESAAASEGVKPTSQVTWSDLTLVAEELAVIVPIHENVVDDATEAVLTEIATWGGQAIGKALDAAVFFGTNKPSSWASPALVPAAVAASQSMAAVDGVANGSDLVGAANQVAAMIALAGHVPSTMISSLALKYRVSNLRDANGLPIFRDESFGGFTTWFNENGAWNAATAEMIIVDSSRVRIGVRQDITVKYLDQATVNGINLAERDMVALRFKARYAYVLGIGATHMGSAKVPVGVVTPDVTS